MIKIFMCEICRECFMEEENAFACESRGVEKPLANVGDVVKRIIKWTDKPHTYEEIRVRKIIKSGHELLYYFERLDGTPHWISIISNEGFLENIKSNV